MKELINKIVRNTFLAEYLGIDILETKLDRYENIFKGMRLRQMAEAAISGKGSIREPLGRVMRHYKGGK